MKKILGSLFSLNNEKKADANVGDVVAGNKNLLFKGILEIIIASDNHRGKKGLTKILKHHEGADFFLHCGDSNLEPEDDVMKQFITVRGNTDYYEGYEEDEFIELKSGDRIWVTHGHRYAVKSGGGDLVKYAKAGHTAIMTTIPPIDIILYGHTHMVDVKMQEGILVINPGSITRPRDGVERTYAVLRIAAGYYGVQILNVSDHSIIKEFQFPRE